MSHPLLAKLKEAMSDTSDVYVNDGVDEQEYFAGLAADLLAHVCTPFPLSASVMPPGFTDIPLGSTITGQCVAYNNGYWLVYQSDTDRFYCFWGTEQNSLEARGVSGSPLCCWSS